MLATHAEVNMSLSAGPFGSDVHVEGKQEIKGQLGKNREIEWSDSAKKTRSCRAEVKNSPAPAHKRQKYQARHR